MICKNYLKVDSYSILWQQRSIKTLITKKTNVINVSGFLGGKLEKYAGG